MVYVGIYYVIFVVWCIILVNYFIIGWFYGLYDKYYLDLFVIYVFIVVVFNGFGNVGLVVLWYWLSEKGFFSVCKFLFVWFYYVVCSLLIFFQFGSVLSGF